MNMDEILETLENEMPRINAISEKAGSIVQDVTNRLNALGVGTFTAVRFTTAMDSNGEKTMSKKALSWGRAIRDASKKGKFAVCINDTVFSECPREDCIEIFPLLPKLLEKLMSKVVKNSEKTKQAMLVVEEMLKSTSLGVK